MANSVDSDQTPQSAASDLGLHCFLRPVFPYTYGWYGKSNFIPADVSRNYQALIDRVLRVWTLFDRVFNSAEIV